MFAEIMDLCGYALSSCASWFSHFESTLAFGGAFLAVFMIVILVGRFLLPLLGQGLSDEVKKAKKESKEAKETKLF